MTTANQLISDALGALGVIGAADPVGGSDAVLGLRILNRLVDSWRQLPHMATHSTWVQFTLPASTQTRTIGPGAQVNTSRPIKLEIGSFTRVNGVDRPLTIAERDQYASADLKTTAGSDRPYAVYYEASSPTGTLYFWPLSGGADVFLAVRAQLTKFADLTTDYTLADGYEAAMVPTLAERLAPYFERPVPASLVREGADARRALKRSNAIVPTLDVCGDAAGRSRLGDFLGGL